MTQRRNRRRMLSRRRRMRERHAFRAAHAKKRVSRAAEGPRRACTARERALLAMETARHPSQARVRHFRRQKASPAYARARRRRAAPAARQICTATERSSKSRAWRSVTVAIASARIDGARAPRAKSSHDAATNGGCIGRGGSLCGGRKCRTSPREQDTACSDAGAEVGLRTGARVRTSIRDRCPRCEGATESSRSPNRLHASSNGAAACRECPPIKGPPRAAICSEMSRSESVFVVRLCRHVILRCRRRRGVHRSAVRGRWSRARCPVVVDAAAAIPTAGQRDPWWRVRDRRGSEGIARDRLK